MAIYARISCLPMALISRNCTGSAITVKFPLGTAKALWMITCFFFKRIFGKSCCNFLLKKISGWPLCKELPTTFDT